MEYNHERFVVNRLCEFSNREVETAFMDYEKKDSLHIVRILTLIMGLTFALFAFSDYASYDTGHNFILSLVLRGAVLALTVAAFFLAKKITRYERTLLMITVTELAVFGIYLVNLYHHKNYEPTMDFMTTMLLIFTVFLIPNKWKNSLIAGCTIFISYIIFSSIFTKPTISPSPSQRGIFLGVCLLSCAVFIFGRESSERKHFAAEQLLEFLSIVDQLTGIYNRGHFERVLHQWVKNKRHDPFCLILFDIDNFKKVNDRFGHSAGDRVLIEIAQVVSANIRDEDIFARWGGEEFVVLFGNTTMEMVLPLAERLRKAVEDAICGQIRKVTISIGIAQYRREENAFEVINRADAKMYEAKRAGKNRVVAEI